jgi:hypothetical protein
MSKEIIFVAGGKGGVGKSTVSKALLDYFTRKGQQTFLIETDAGNPDVFRAYGRVLPSTNVDLRSEDGWVDLLNAVDEWVDGPIVVNTAARAHENLERHAPLLQEAISAGIPVTWLFMLGRQRESMEILADHIKNAVGQTHVVLNGYFGDADTFDLFKGSKSKVEIEKKGGMHTWLPPLSSKLNYEIDYQRLTFQEAYEKGKLGDKAALTFWRQKCDVAFDALFQQQNILTAQ